MDERPADDFETRSNERPVGLIRELWDFLVTHKRWWLIPIVLSLVTFGLLILFASQSVLAPFLYPLF